MDIKAPRMLSHQLRMFSFECFGDMDFGIVFVNLDQTSAY